MENQNFTVDLKLEGPSTDVVKVRPEDFKIVADMSTYALKIGENTIPVQIISYPENITIKNNGFLGIKVNLEELVKKDFTIQSKVKISYRDNIYEMNRKVTPDTVTVSGGSSTIDKISSAVISGEESGISGNFEKSYNIKFIDSNGDEVTGVSSNIDTAKLSVKVSNGKSVPIDLKTTGTPKTGLELQGYELSSNYVNIAGSSDVLSQVQYIDTEIVDISQLDKTSEINVKLLVPEGVIITNGQEYVKVTVTLKAQETVSKKLDVTIQYNNLKDNLNLESSSEKVGVTVSGIQAELDKINEGSLSAILDLSNITDEGSYSNKPEVSFNIPTTASITSIDQVDIIVKKKIEQ